MALPDEIAADTAELEIEQSTDGTTPQRFTFAGGLYDCVLGSVTRGKTLGSGGYGIGADLVLFVRTNLFATADDRPQTKETLEFNSQDYVIDDIVTPAGEPFLKLICRNTSRRL